MYRSAPILRRAPVLSSRAARIFFFWSKRFLRGRSIQSVFFEYAFICLKYLQLDIYFYHVGLRARFLSNFVLYIFTIIFNLHFRISFLRLHDGYILYFSFFFLFCYSGSPKTLTNGSSLPQGCKESACELPYNGGLSLCEEYKTGTLFTKN